MTDYCPAHRSLYHAGCPACQEARRAKTADYAARQARGTVHHVPRGVPDEDLTPLLACCGTWHPITRLPYRCPTCGTGYFQEGSIGCLTQR